MWTQKLIIIKESLARLVYERETIETIVVEAGLPPEQIDLDGKASDVWRRVITESIIRERFDALIKTAIKNTGNNDLEVSYDDYLHDPAPADTDDNRLPIQPALIGRDKEIKEYTDLLRQPEVRLLTLTGPSGVGKTALAIYVAANLFDEFNGQVTVVELASLDEQASMETEIGNSMRTYKQTVGVDLITFLRNKQKLMVLDSFETVINAAPLVTTIIGNCPQVKLIVTSEQPLATEDDKLLPWEKRLKVSPLSYPGSVGSSRETPLAEYTAVKLFLARAEAIGGDGPLERTRENLEAIAEICKEVSGLPLCIQILASLISTYDPPRLLKLLRKHRFAGLDPRQQLIKAIKIRYDRLQAGEQTLFRRLAIFAGSFSDDAVEEICGSVKQKSVTVINVLPALVDRSFVQSESGRYQMLHVIRDYAQKQLDATDEAVPLRIKHAEYYLQLAQKAEPELKTPRRREHLNRLEQEYDNLRAIFDWSIDPAGDLETGLALAGALFWYWDFLAYFREGQEQVRRILKKVTTQGPSKALASALYCDGGLTFLLGEYPDAQTQLTKSVEMWRAIGDQSGLAYALIILGMVKKEIGEDLGAARQHEEESVAILESLNDEWGLALAFNDLGNVMVAQGKDHYAEALRSYEESRRKWERRREPWGLSLVLSNLSSLECKKRQYDSAYKLMNDALKIQDQEKDKWGRAWSLKGLGEAKLGKKEYVEAASYFYQSFCLHTDLGRKQLVAECLEGLAKAASGLEQALRGAYLIGAAEKLRSEAGSSGYYAMDKEYKNLLKNLGNNLSPTQFKRARAEGRTVNQEDLPRQVQVVLQELIKTTS